MNLSGRLIDAFLALEETRRFAVAAERCHVTASAFSQMIGRLEESVGARLFDRTTRKVSLTPDGEVFAVGARRIAAEIETSVAEMHDRAALRRGRVAIAAPASVSAVWLPGLLAAYREAYPGVALRLHDVMSDHCLALVLRGEVDFALNAQRGNDQEFESHLLFKEGLYLICRKDDPLARQKRIVLKDLRQRLFIHTVRIGSVWQRLQPLLQKANVRDSGFEVAQFGTVAGLIQAGFGISVVPHFAVSLCTRPDLVAVPVAARDAQRPLYMLKRRDSSLSTAAQELWTRVEAAGRERARSER